MAGIDLNGTVKESVKQVPGMVALIVAIWFFLQFMSEQSTSLQLNQTETNQIHREMGVIVDRNTLALGRMEHTLEGVNEIMEKIAGD